MYRPEETIERSPLYILGSSHTSGSITKITFLDVISTLSSCIQLCTLQKEELISRRDSVL